MAPTGPTVCLVFPEWGGEGKNQAPQWDSSERLHGITKANWNSGGGGGGWYVKDVELRGFILDQLTRILLQHDPQIDVHQRSANTVSRLLKVLLSALLISKASHPPRLPRTIQVTNIIMEMWSIPLQPPIYGLLPEYFPTLVSDHVTKMLNNYRWVLNVVFLNIVMTYGHHMHIMLAMKSHEEILCIPF